jgi:small subunit ribosomal protein S29e
MTNLFLLMLLFVCSEQFFQRNLNKMGHQAIWYSHPRKFGKGSRQCRTCGNHNGLIRKYHINMCRQCFRVYAKDIGFQKFR